MADQRIRGGGDDNRLQRCPVRGKDSIHGRIVCGDGPVGCSDWLRVCGTVVVWPRGVRLGYIRRAPSRRSSTDAAPVTGSLVFSALLDCLDVYCATEFVSCLLFGGTDCVWLAGFGLYIVNMFRPIQFVLNHYDDKFAMVFPCNDV